MNGVSILIPTYNRATILAQTLDSLAHLDVPPETDVEVVVVANACTDHTEKMLAELLPRLPFPGSWIPELRANQNVARNAAVRHSRYELLALLDDDVWVDRAWLNGLVEAYRNPAVDIVAGRIELWWKDVERPSWFTPMMDRLLTCKDYGELPKRLFNPYHAAGANFSFRRKVFDTVGPFLEGLDRTGANVGLSAGESEFLTRALAAGFQMYYCPDVSVRHWVAPQRTTQAYLCRVAFANAASRTLIKPRFNVYHFLRTALGNAGVYVFHALRGAWYRLRGIHSEHVVSQVRMAGSRGAWYGLWLRLSGRSPLR